MGPLEAVGTVFSKYAMFRGRAPRSEYWWFYLFEIIAFTVFIAIDLSFLMNDPIVLNDPTKIDFFSLFTLYYTLISFIPRLAVTVRRLHDAGMSGFLILAYFVPFVGWLIMLVLMMMPSENDENIHGTPYRPMGGRASRANVGGQQKHDPMQGYAHLMQNDQKVPEEVLVARQEARKAEVRKLYEERVLGVKAART
ncbi:MAG: DUF805 domain-containing protein [Paracoccaceae bacterium]